MNADQLLGRTLVFGRLLEDKKVEFQTLGTVTLLPDGRIGGRCHANEATWQILDSVLTFFHEAGHPTTRFVGTWRETTEVLTGPCQVAPFTHFLYPYGDTIGTKAKILYLIASNIRFDKPRDVLLEQLGGAGVPAEQIRVTISQAHSAATWTQNGVTFSQVRENCFEYTALLDAAQGNLDFDYAFLLHDTCHIGPKFQELVRAQPLTIPWDYMPVARNAQFNIGLYGRQFLSACLPYFESLDGISKREAIAIEKNAHGRGFRSLAGVSTNFLDGRNLPIGFRKLYGSDQSRVEVYLPGADVYKFWGRWQQTSSGWKQVGEPADAP
jgi:hypothetical protein